MKVRHDRARLPDDSRYVARHLGEYLQVHGVEVAASPDLDRYHCAAVEIDPRPTVSTFTKS